jgi:hypothetical protein
MKLRLFASIFAASAIALSSIATISQPSNAQTTTYFCGKSKNGVPTTYARIATGKNIAIIRWVRTFGKYTPQVRCEEVSGRFQVASQDDALNYISTDKKNGQQVLCSAKRYGEACSHLLLILKPDDDDVNKAIEDLKEIGSVVGAPVLLIDVDDYSPQTFIDMNRLLREAQAED